MGGNGRGRPCCWQWKAGNDVHVGAVHGLFVHQELDQLGELAPVVAQDRLSLFANLFEQSLDLAVDGGLSLLRVRAAA